MNIKFIDEKTVEIEASTDWYPARPHVSKRKIVNKNEILDIFKKQYPSYNIGSVSGPDEISNFRGKEDSKGVWTLTVSKVSKTTKAPQIKKTPKPKVEKSVSEPKESAPPPPKAPSTFRKITKKGA